MISTIHTEKLESGPVTFFHRRESSLVSHVETVHRIFQNQYPH